MLLSFLQHLHVASTGVLYKRFQNFDIPLNSLRVEAQVLQWSDARFTLQMMRNQIKCDVGDSHEKKLKVFIYPRETFFCEFLVRFGIAL